LVSETTEMITLTAMPPSIRLPVSSLLALGRPSAILRLVITIVVDSLDRVAARPLAHVGQEVLERKPSFADRDSSAAVSMERKCVGIQASRFHGLPRRIGWMQRAMSPAGAMLDSGAAATVVLPGTQFIAANNSEVSTFAATFPQSATPRRSHVADYRELPKLLTSYLCGRLGSLALQASASAACVIPRTQPMTSHADDVSAITMALPHRKSTLVRQTIGNCQSANSVPGHINHFHRVIIAQMMGT
jgi:hypothetical protein